MPVGWLCNWELGCWLAALGPLRTGLPWDQRGKGTGWMLALARHKRPIMLPMGWNSPSHCTRLLGGWGPASAASAQAAPAPGKLVQYILEPPTSHLDPFDSPSLFSFDFKYLVTVPTKPILLKTTNSHGEDRHHIRARYQGLTLRGVHRAHGTPRLLPGQDRRLHQVS